MTRADEWTTVTRRTRETTIAIKLRLEGAGRARIGLKPDFARSYFLRHMLESFALHGGLDLEVTAEGEDEHHLIEDIGIALGQTLRRAVPQKIERFAHAVIPMDDALVLVALDLIDRPYAEVALPDRLYAHMLRSLALEGKFTLHVRPLAGDDPHHVTEAAFKGLGRALRQATRPVRLPRSTKGEVDDGSG